MGMLVRWIITSVSAFLGVGFVGLLKYKQISPKQWILVKSLLTS